jgi:hypothetical protein
MAFNIAVDHRYEAIVKRLQRWFEEISHLYGEAPVRGSDREGDDEGGRAGRFCR